MGAEDPNLKDDYEERVFSQVKLGEYNGGRSAGDTTFSVKVAHFSIKCEMKCAIKSRESDLFG